MLKGLHVFTCSFIQVLHSFSKSNYIKGRGQLLISDGLKLVDTAWKLPEIFVIIFIVHWSQVQSVSGYSKPKIVKRNKTPFLDNGVIMKRPNISS